MAGDVLYIGIDELSPCNGFLDSHEEEELTVIGTPKDPRCKFLEKRCLFGEADEE